MHHCNYKIFFIALLVCLLNVEGMAQLDPIRLKVMRTAAQDIGFTEKGHNTGKVYTYYREVYQTVTGAKQAEQSATCGVALYSWYLSAGINPNIKRASQAKAWYEGCKKPIMLWSMTVLQLSQLPRASAIIFKVGGGHHVGLFVKASGYTLYTIEANTSTNRSLVKYLERQEGQFLCKTRIGDRSITPYAICDIIPQSTHFNNKEILQIEYNLLRNGKRQ